jgi:hypothetical protein
VHQLLAVCFSEEDYLFYLKSGFPMSSVLSHHIAFFENGDVGVTGND